MKVEGYKVKRLRVPLVTPFKTALRQVDHIDTIALMITTDSGHVGFGEAPATEKITGDTLKSITAALHHQIMPAIMGMSINDIEDICAAIKSVAGDCGSARAAAEMAVFDLLGQGSSEPLYKLLGGDRAMLTTDVTISVDTPDKMIKDCMLAISQGYQTLKVKIGNDLTLDMKRVQEIAKAVPADIAIRLDVNQGWTHIETLTAIEALDAAGISLELIEQPVAADDYEGMRAICQQSHIPIMADESAFSPDDVRRLLDMRAADIINIKLMKSGGITGALQIADIAEDYGIPCMMGCMLESSISVIAAAHVAVARRAAIPFIDLDGPSLCSAMAVDASALFAGPEIDLGDRSGLGVRSLIDDFVMGGSDGD